VSVYGELGVRLQGGFIKFVKFMINKGLIGYKYGIILLKVSVYGE